MDSKLLFAIANKQDIFPESEILRDQVLESRNALLHYMETVPDTEAWLYGVDTNFGPHAYLGLPNRIAIQQSLVDHLSVTKNKSEYYISHQEARAVLVARIQVLGLGRSGVRLELIEKLIQLLNDDDIPDIPIHGSLGASGDLIPLSAIAKHLQDSGWTWEAKEAIAITNGTSSMVGCFAYQLEYCVRLANVLLDALAEQMNLLPVFPDAFHPDISKVMHSPGSEYTITQLNRFLIQRNKARGSRFQDSYIIRAIPQIWGAFFDVCSRLENSVNKELNVVSDNPIYSFIDKRFIEGALFYGGHISQMIDEWNIALVNLGNWLERMIQFLLDPKENEDQLPLLLSPTPGESAGLAGLGLLATHTIAEMRRDAMPASIQSIPSNAGNQNIVPMGSLGIIRNRRTMKGFQTLVEIYIYCVRQVSYLKETAPFAENFRTLFSHLEPISKDRPLGTELTRIEGFLREEILKRKFVQ